MWKFQIGVRAGALFAAAVLLIWLPAASFADPAAGSLTSDLGAILADPALKGGIDGVVVADTETGKILFQQNADTLLIPASNRKLFTGAAALALLGPDRVETTRVIASQPASADGTITGDITLRGGGDPLLMPSDLDSMAAGIAAKGVHHITGGVVADSSLFANEPWGDGWQVDSLLDYYSPEIDALEVNEGLATVSLHGGAAAGAPTTFTVDPSTSYFTIVNNATTGPAGSAVNITRDRPLTSTIFVFGGSIPVGSSPDPTDDDTDGRITVPNPPLYAATLLAERLRAHGVAVDGMVKSGVAPAGGTVLASHDSLPMSQMLAKMLKPSDNLIAEMLTRLEATKGGGQGSYDAGFKIECGYFSSLGINPRDYSFVDGSGVSRIDIVTPHAEMQLLLALKKRPDFKTFYDAMSIVGVDGTAASRMKGTPVAGNAHVKTGTVRRCRSLSGYVTDKGGKMLAFVILMNNHVATAHELGGVQDRIVERLAAEQ